jgi:hypothetical protein
MDYAFLAHLLDHSSFAKPFYSKPFPLSKAQSDADKLLSNLEDLQITLRLYSMCTANKITHLLHTMYTIYNTALDKLPKQHWLWNSDITNKFSTMMADLLANIANQSSLPIYS